MFDYLLEEACRIVETSAGGPVYGYKAARDFIGSAVKNKKLAPLDAFEILETAKSRMRQLAGLNFFPDMPEDSIDFD